MEPRHFREAIQAAQQGDRERAYQLMRQVLVENPGYVPAWVWMSRLVDDSGQQRECLERALAARVPGAGAGDRAALRARA
jgi:hypothetical protein